MATAAESVRYHILGSGINPKPYSEEVLRRCINARIARFTKTRCTHIEPNACKCINPSREVLRKYLFTVLSKQEVHQGNFHALFNQAYAERNLSEGEKVLYRSSSTFSSESAINWKKFALMVFFSIVIVCAISAIGVFLCI